MLGIAEFLAEGSDKLIVAELPDGHVMLTMVNTITHERHSITMRRTEAHAAGLTIRFAARSVREVDEPILGLNGPPIDFTAYHFDPHTLLAVILLSLAIAILLVTAVIPERE